MNWVDVVVFCLIVAGVVFIMFDLGLMHRRLVKQEQKNKDEIRKLVKQEQELARGE